MIKQLCCLVILCVTTLSFAQFGNNSRQRQNFPGPQQQQSPKPKFEVEKYVGVVIYEIEKVAKKSGVKLSSETGKKFARIITNYNKSIKDIARINSFVLKNTKNMVESFQKTAIETGDFSRQQKVMKTMSENLKPIADNIKKEDLLLDEKIQAILSEKQHKKWLKYNRKFNKTFSKKE